MWSPKLHIMNGVQPWQTELNCRNPRASTLRIHYNGRVDCWLKYTVRAACHMQFDNYPYDEHKCPLIFFDPRYLNVQQSAFIADPTVITADLVYNTELNKINRSMNVAGWKLDRVSSVAAFSSWFTPS